ncbi:stage III sporulation protein AF [Halanaerobacter jeridensis]|uniref:Stage III sporulation protein AF n=1 Tax=Halanaerobacter jeridensis TaxID=706427 RepID=A0A938XPX5_9FIRM|nr:stage III sporulation protein AF [Halanaerobacter jeridensis]MBM7555226.1 stage III sporulation protein AF [Halanaerobacter jeridensis]
MEQIKLWVKNIVLIVLFANFIEMLLPNNKFRGYIRVVIGFFVILVIIVPFIELLSFRPGEVDLSLIDNNNRQQNLEEILAAGNRLRKEEAKEIRKNYKKKLSKQLTAVINLNTQLQDPKINVVLNNQNEVEKIIIDTTSQKITPVQVEINQNESEKKKESQQHNLKQLLINLYGFDEDEIEVK